MKFSSQNKRVLCINPSWLETSIGPDRQKAHHNLVTYNPILCGITCPIIKSLFYEHALKYVEDVEDFIVMCNLQGKQKLHLRIQMLITARSIEGTIINYIYSYSPQTGDLFGGGLIFVNYSIRKL